MDARPSDHELVMLEGKVDLYLDKIQDAKDADDQELKEIVRDTMINDLYGYGLNYVI